VTDDDDLAPARGLCCGLALGAIAWLPILAAAYLVARRLVG
jgi:hypothetical protein